MSQEPSNDDHIQKQANRFLNFFSSYIETYWKVFSNPETSLSHLILSKGPHKVEMASATFLVTNMAIAFTLQVALGFPPPSLPFQLHQSIDLPAGYLKYILGLLLFSIFLLLRVSRLEFPRGLLKILPIIGYASVVYIPLSFVGILSHYPLKNLSLDLNTIIIEKHFQFHTFWIIALIIVFILYVAGIIWWLYLIRLGTMVVWPEHLASRQRLIITRVFIRYALYKCIITIGMMIVLSWSLFVGQFQWQSLKIKINEKSAECDTLYNLSLQVFSNDSLPPYPRYVAGLITATCQPLIFPLLKTDTTFINQVINMINQKKYDRARKILDQFIKKIEANKPSGYIALHMIMTNYLNQADKLYQSPGYIELEKDDSVILLWNSAIIAIFP